MFVDIDALKQTERAMKAARDYAEATVRTARDPFIVLRGDLRINSANEAFYKTFKVTPDQIEGCLIYELGNHQWDIPKLRNLLEEILPRNSFFDDFEVTHDFPQIGRRTMLLNARRLNLEDGLSPLILLSIEDVTERLESRAAVRESEERYRTLFDLNPVAVYTIDTSGVIQNFNRHAAELWGRQPVRGDTDQRFCGSFKMFRPDGSFMPHDECPMAEVVSGKIAAAHDAEVHIERPDGSRIAVVVNIRPLKNDRGEVIGAINCFYDITGRKRSEKELAEILAREKAAHRAKDDFLAALSHELRTPLNPVLLLASDSAIDPDLSPQVRANFDTIRKNIELEARLIDDLLDLTRITHGKLVINQSELDVHHILNDAISTVLNEIEKKQILLKLDLHADSHKIFGDAVRLQQIFWNVLKNAVKFTYEGGQIMVESQTVPGDKILINITDTGIGMNPDETEHIFGAFAQGPHQFGGLGLGLAISRVLVELHSGSIRAASPGKGKGSTFSIELPLISPSEKKKTTGLPPATVSMPAATIEKMPGGNLHILLVEDHEPTRLALTQLLLQRHYEVASAASFAEACSLMEKHEDFELLISDIGLPDGSGYDLMNEFHKKFGAKGIALTGYGSEQDVAQSQSSGFTVHLTKPVRIELLENALAAAFAETTENIFLKNGMPR